MLVSHISSLSDDVVPSFTYDHNNLRQTFSAIINYVYLILNRIKEKYMKTEFKQNNNIKTLCKSSWIT